MSTRQGLTALSLLSLALIASPLCASGDFSGVTPLAASAGQDRVVVAGNVHPQIASRPPLRATDKNLPMERMIMLLKMSPTAQASLDALLARQQDPTSADYHAWLSPEQFAERFAPAPADQARVQNWLEANGFRIETMARGGMTIEFTGTVDQVEKAFQTSIMDVDINGTTRHGNVTDISLPSALASTVHGIVSLHNIPRPSHNVGFQSVPDWSGTANSKAGVYCSPTDWATIYNAAASYTANGNGSGVTIGICGRTNPGTTNWANFRSALGLPANTPSIIVNGTNPGDLGAGEDGEADLDAEWSGGTAPGAAVKFVASASTSSTDGVDLSATYIVNNNLADVMSTSFGQCESSMGTTECAFYNTTWSQAASQGITACVSTGDSGAAGCGGGSDTSGTGEGGVNGIASTPYNIAVGATQLSTSSSYWTSGAPTGYIPETPWNESGTVTGGSGLWSTSSGVSTTYAKPSWQVCTGVPSTNSRFLPDVVIDGSDMFFGNYGMLVYTQGAMATTGGTSAASPSFAGVMALVIQKYGRQGNANTTLYKLGNAQYASGGAAIFHDITSGNNNVPGLTGFTAGTGWDEVTGLGSPNILNLVNGWSGSTGNTVTATITAPTANETIASGTSVSFTGSATDSSSTATLSYAWTFGDGATATGTTASHTYTNTGTANVAETVTLKVTDNTSVTGTATRTITVTPAAVVAVAITPATASISPSATQQFTATVTGSSNTAVTWTCSGGTVSATGLYTAPAAAGSYTVTATSNADTTKKATATVTVGTQTVAVTLTPATATVSTGATQQFTATVTGSSNTAVTWTATGGTVSTAGLYTAPSTAGTYTVKATSAANTAISASATVTVTAATAKNLILNGGFESGVTSWSGNTSDIGNWSSQGEAAHTGSDSAWLCGYGSAETDNIKQSVAIPSTITKATLTYWLHINSTLTGTAYDKFAVQVLSSTGSVLGTVGSVSNLNAGTGYTQYTYDLSAYKGKTVTLNFTGTESGKGTTSFVLDDVSLNVQ